MIVSVAYPEFIPYLGFWNRMHNSDVIVIADTMRFRHRHYQNRAAIRTPDGWGWLTIPVNRNGRYIKDIEVKSYSDSMRVFGVLESNYGNRAPFFDEFRGGLVEGFSYRRLIDINLYLINYIKGVLNIPTKIVLVSDIVDMVTEDFLALSIHVCNVLGADSLLMSSGNIGTLPLRYPNSKVSYIFQDYINLAYNQIYEGWYPRMSVVDCLLTHGADHTRKHVVAGFSVGGKENGSFCCEK